MERDPNFTQADMDYLLDASVRANNILHYIHDMKSYLGATYKIIQEGPGRGNTALLCQAFCTFITETEPMDQPDAPFDLAIIDKIMRPFFPDVLAHRQAESLRAMLGSVLAIRAIFTSELSHKIAAAMLLSHAAHDDDVDADKFPAQIEPWLKSSQEQSTATARTVAMMDKYIFNNLKTETDS